MVRAEIDRAATVVVRADSDRTEIVRAADTVAVRVDSDRTEIVRADMEMEAVRVDSTTAEDPDSTETRDQALAVVRTAEDPDLEVHVHPMVRLPQSHRTEHQTKRV